MENEILQLQAQVAELTTQVGDLFEFQQAIRIIITIASALTVCAGLVNVYRTFSKIKNE